MENQVFLYREESKIFPSLSVKLFTKLKEERENHAATVEDFKSIKEMLINHLKIMDTELKDVYETGTILEIMARRYFNFATGYRELLKENGIKIPSKLKITRSSYAKDLLYLRSGRA